MATSKPSRPHLPTVLAVGMVCFLLAKIAHEGVGHGGACVALGGDLRAFSTSWCDCEAVGESMGDMRVRKAAGTVANLALGLFALGALRLPFGGASRYAWWLLAAVNLLMGSGYLLTDPVFGFGDWTAFLEGLPGAWRWVLAATGAALYAGSVVLLVREGDACFGDDARVETAWFLTLAPFLAIGGVAMTLAASFNELGPQYAISSAMATLGGTSALAWMPTIVGPSRGGAPSPVGPHRGWLGAGAVALALALAVFGPGVHP